MPWTQAEFNTYMQIVRTANPDYEKRTKSSLHEVTGLLKMKRYQPSPQHFQALNAAWNNVPANKQQLYARAWAFAMAQIQPAPVAVPPLQMRAAPPPPGPVPNPASQILQARAGLRPVVHQPAPTPPPQAPQQLANLRPVVHQPAATPPPQVLQQVARAAQVQAGLAAQDRLVATRVQQFHNGQPYDWPVSFTLRRSEAGKMWKSITVLLTIAAFSGNSAALQAAVANNHLPAIPNTHAGATLTEEVKLNWKYRINQRWSGASFVATDVNGDDLDIYKIEFDFNWVTNPAQACQTVYAVKTTDLSQPLDGTINTMYWGVDDGGNKGAAIAHEFGHLIGNPDEYGTCRFNGRNNTRDHTSIMDDETNGQSKAGHYYLIANEICAMLNVDPLRSRIRLGNENYNVWVNHPWG